ncbi:17145_t:CDS:2 [Gigaspora margarita]|uniref:17145_t:CDS:1 n=1 Tax=Gigaspora margarita TaxID=4874 RepID=A0ABN7V2H4_GIGMA|nr:17145_t:CDS:2 [Gigaspora margarita]
MDFMVNSQIINNTGMSEYGKMFFSDQQPVPAIMKIMNGSVNAIANYSNKYQIIFAVNVVASQLYRCLFCSYLGNDIDGNYSPKFLFTQIEALLRKGHYLINTCFVNAGSGTILPIEGTLNTSIIAADVLDGHLDLMHQINLSVGVLALCPKNSET